MTRPLRHLRADETRLLTKLLSDAGNVELAARLGAALVVEMDDGGMGSLKFVSNRATRKFGRQVSELQFTDVDGIPVSAALNVDDEGELFELDIFKADFSRLKSLPKD